MKAYLITGAVSLVVGVLMGYTLNPPQPPKIVEVVKEVEIVREVEVEVETVVTVDRVVERRVTETKSDKTIIITEEKITDRSFVTEEKKTEKKVEEKQVAKSETETFDHTPFTVGFVTNPTRLDLTNTLLTVGYQPFARVPIAVIAANPLTSIRPMVGLSFRF